MAALLYSLVVEATDEPDYFGFFSEELEGFTGIGTSVEDCIRQAETAMPKFVAFLEKHGCPVPPPNPKPKVCVINLAADSREIEALRLSA